MGLKKQVEFGNNKIEVTKTAVYFNGEPFEHSDVMELIDWLYDEVQPYTQQIQKVPGYPPGAIVPIEPFQVQQFPVIKAETKVLRDEELHPEKYANLPTPEQIGNRTQGVEAAMKLKVGDAFKGAQLPNANQTGQAIMGVEAMDIAKLAAQSGAIVTEKRSL